MLRAWRQWPLDDVAGNKRRNDMMLLLSTYGIVSNQTSQSSPCPRRDVPRSRYAARLRQERHKHCASSGLRLNLAGQKDRWFPHRDQAEPVHGTGAGDIEQVAVHLRAEHLLAGIGDDDPVKLQPLGQMRRANNDTCRKTCAALLQQATLDTRLGQ